MLKKYFVFISSTIDDLKAERLLLSRIVSELGAVPIVMDAFDIGKDTDRKFIYRAIESCDYFVALCAYRGGGIADGKAALELEYSHAINTGIPVLALPISEKARWKASKKEKDADTALALEKFKKKLQNHPHETWVSLVDLRQKAVSLLNREMSLNPGAGWARSSQTVDPSVANELCRLLRENEIFRSHFRFETNGEIKNTKGDIRKLVEYWNTIN